MLINLKQRFFTSLGLIFLLTLMFFNIYVLAYFLMIIGIFSILEFAKMVSIFQKNKLFKIIFFNILFLIYVFTVFSTFLVLSFFTHLKLLLFIILITCISSDIGGYTFGKIFKGPKLTKISPRKTISGSVGSIIFSMIVLTSLIYYFTKNFELKFVLIGLLISVVCQLGDLFFSFLKRKSKIKDTGNILPGHGGILDRVDGILLGLPFGFTAMIMLY